MRYPPNSSSLQFRTAAGLLLSAAAALLILYLSSIGLQAQPTSAPPNRDPLMSLMLSQPRIDVESPVEPLAMFDPPAVRPGEKAIYRVTFNALEESIEWPGKLPAPDGVEVEAGGHGQMLSMAGAKLEPRTSFNFRLVSKTPGLIEIPQFKVMVYGQPVTVPAAQLEVTNTPVPTLGPAQSLVIEVPQTNPFVGEAVPVNILFPGLVGIAMQGQAPVQLIGDGFVADQSTFHPRFEPRARAFGRTNMPVFIYEGIVTPIASGNVSFFVQSFVAVRPGNPGITMVPPGGANAPIYTLLDSDRLNLKVRPLPQVGRLPGFTGAVGSFSVEQPELTTNVVRVGEPIKLSVKVHGDGNLLRLVPPPPPRPRAWQVLPGAAESSAPQIIRAQGFTTFTFTLIPLSEKARYTPAIAFCAFDPEHEVYQDLTIPAVPVTIKPGAGRVDLEAIAQANALNVEPEKEPTLSDLAVTPGLGTGNLAPVQRQAWFPVVQLIPALALGGLWYWDRRRRYYELHLEELLRRRARRALRRERRALQNAARLGDAPRFAATAASALRVACAPHYPAEPRALVGSDVLALLPDSERTGRSGEVIKRFFTAFDAERFATGQAVPTEMLSLQPELERVLQQLEEKL